MAGPGPAVIDGNHAVERSSRWEELGTRTRALEVDADEGEWREALLVVDRRFRFLNEERELSEIDWSTEYVSPLWTYHLHYFDYAVDLAVAHRETDERRFADRYVELWTGWLDAAEQARAWIDPYPTSVRCMNALRSLWWIEPYVPAPFRDRLLAATHAQLEWLADNLERHLRANHLQKNLSALAWGTLAFDEPSKEGWSGYRGELWDQVGEQILADGGHFERSPMYHAVVLDDLLRTLALCDAAGVAVPVDVPTRLAAMTRALQLLSRPDGTFHLFNDATDGERPGRNEVLRLARQVLGGEFPEPTGMFALTKTGYYGTVCPSAGRRLVIDAGPLGPSYQPGHAHCDMLSFELDLAGRPVVVDAGVHGYDGDPYREYVRSTRAHNTVAINRRDQHEMWATFRVARRGRILGAGCRETSEGFEFEGACRHYHDRRSVHRRVILLGGDELVVTDRVEGAAGRPLTSWLHLHPDFRVESSDAGFVAVADAPVPLRVRIELFGVDESVVLRGVSDPAQGWYCPQFGLAVDAAVIEMRVDANDGREFGYRIVGVVA